MLALEQWWALLKVVLAFTAVLVSCELHTEADLIRKMFQLVLRGMFQLVRLV